MKKEWKPMEFIKLLRQIAERIEDSKDDLFVYIARYSVELELDQKTTEETGWISRKSNGITSIELIFSLTKKD